MQLSACNILVYKYSGARGIRAHNTMTATEQENGHVQVSLSAGQQVKGDTKSPATLDEVQAAPVQQAAAPSKCAGMANSSSCLWILFVLGFVCPPCWWVAATAGLQGGSDSQWLIRRRKDMPKASSIAWWASVVMCTVSAVAIILGCAIFFGSQRGPEQEGPFFMVLAGPADILSNLSDPSRLTLIAAAVHSGLGLAASYPVNSISVWVDSSIPVSPTPGRRLLAATPDPAGNETMQVSVLGYSLAKTSSALPGADDLAALMDNSTIADMFSQQLVKTGLVSEERAAKLSVGLTSARTREALEAMLQRHAEDGNPAFHLVPVGKRCKGWWTDWTPCNRDGMIDGCAGNQSRTFIVPPRTSDNHTDAESSTRRLHGAKEHGNSDHGSSDHGNSAGGIEHDAGQGQGSAQGHDTDKPKVPNGHGSDDQAHGLAAAFGQGQGLALALGHVSCSVVNNTVETRTCTETCLAADCPDMPAATVPTVAFTWNCTHGTVNGSTCLGACTTSGITASAQAVCNNGTYVDTTCLSTP